MWRNKQKESTERETLEEHKTITETRHVGQGEIKPSLENDHREKCWQVKEQQLTVRANLHFQALTHHPPMTGPPMPPTKPRKGNILIVLLRQEKYFV